MCFSFCNSELSVQWTSLKMIIKGNCFGYESLWVLFVADSYLYNFTCQIHIREECCGSWALKMLLKKLHRSLIYQYFTSWTCVSSHMTLLNCAPSLSRSQEHKDRSSLVYERNFKASDYKGMRERIKEFTDHRTKTSVTKLRDNYALKHGFVTFDVF